jgi:hypothetical protein
MRWRRLRCLYFVIKVRNSSVDTSVVVLDGLLRKQC